MKTRILYLWLCFCIGFSALNGRADELMADTGAKSQNARAVALIFIHGWTDDHQRWNTSVQWLRSAASQGALRGYNVYRYKYDWSQKIERSGLELGRAIERIPEARCVIVAHSMGGLVARSAIENYTGETAGVESRLLKLITIATPHHGTPAANIAWLRNDSKIERLDAGQWSMSLFTKLNTGGAQGLGWDNSDGQMPQAVWNGRREIGAIPNAIPRASRFTQQLNARRNLDGGAKRRLVQKYVAIGAYQSYVPDLSPSTLAFVAKGNFNLAELKRTVGNRDAADLWRRIVNLDKTDFAGRVMLARYLQNSDDPKRKWNERIRARWVDNYVANDDVVPLQSALFLDDGMQIGNLNGEQLHVAQTAANGRHNRIGSIKIISDVGHSDLPDHSDVLSFLAAILRENTGVEASNQLASRWKGDWRGEDGHRFSFDLSLNFPDGRQSEGRFMWTLTGAPPNSPLRGRIGESGIEHVRGSYQAATRELNLQGFRLEHDNLLGLDAYRVTIAPDGKSFSGYSRSHSGRWLSPISARSTSVPAEPETTGNLQQAFAGQWRGNWAGDDGARFGFVLQLQGRDGRCEGIIQWTKRPSAGADGNGVGQSGREFVRGTFDETSGRLDLKGYRVDTPGLLATDEYRLTIAPKDRALSGVSRNNTGRWRSAMSGRFTSRASLPEPRKIHPFALQ